ncbi:MAG: hypothetical protein J6Y72_04365 [Bacteroidales bacterium]|nr:hypothetical protein [Bacteroidales bacterium]
MNSKVKIAILCALVLAILYFYTNRDAKSAPEKVIVKPTAIDLGLPSGLLWASHNIGATKNEEIGDFFAWGETKTKSLFSRDTYKHYRSDSLSDGFTKYCHISSRGYKGFSDTLSTLELCDDAANVILGGNWRIPTRADWQELLKECQYESCVLNGLNGCKLTGPNGNFIYLPFGGSCYDNRALTHHLTDNNRVDGGGYYWSSTLCDGWTMNVWCAEFGYVTGFGVREFFNRNFGFSVRAVCSAE